MTAELALQLFIYGLSSGSVLALNALGFTIVYGSVRILNFAHGEIFALSTVLVGTLIAVLGLGPTSPPPLLLLEVPLLLLAAMTFGAALNLLVERLAFRPFRGRSPLGALVATLAISLVLFQIALWWRTIVPPSTGSAPNPHHGAPNVPLRRVPDLFPSLELLAAAGLTSPVRLILKDLLIVLLAIGVSLGLAVFLRRTGWGKAVRATALDPELAALCGVNTDRATALAFALGGAVAGAAGLIFTQYTNGLFTQHGALSGLAAFTAAILGGVGSPGGALAAGLLLGILSAFSDFLLDAHWTPVLVLVTLVLLLAVRPTGLMGAESREEPAAQPERRERPAAKSLVQSRVSRWPLIPLAAVGLASLYPWVDAGLGLHALISAVLILLYVSLALGLNIVTGLAGLLDLGYAAFFALGGYTTALLTASGSRFATGLPVALGDSTVVVLVSGLTAALAGCLLALPALRMRPEYLAMTTLAFGEIVPGVIRHLDDWTGGSRGIAGIPRPRLFGTVLEEPAAWYEISLGLVVLAGVTTARLRSARQGRAWAAVSQDELAAASAGVAPVQAKLLAFALGAALAGLAGSLFASTVGYVEPGQFDFMLSMTTLAMVMVGGHAGIRGTILGALLIASYDRFAISQADTALRQLGTLSGLEFLRAADLRQANYLVFGLTLYLTVLLRAAPWSHRRRPPCPTRSAPSPPDDRAARRSANHHGP